MSKPFFAPRESTLVITNWRDSSHPQAGGAEVVCEKLAERFAAEGHDVVLLAAAVAGAPATEQRNGYTVIRRGGRFTVYPWALLWLFLHRGSIEGVIDSQNGIPFFTPLVVRRQTPVVLLLHHVHQAQWGLYFSPFVATAGRWLERVGCRVVYGKRAIAAVSPSTRQAARRQLHLRGPIHVVSPGLSSAGPAMPRPRVRAEHECLVCVGRLVPHKRTELIIEAMPALAAEFPDLQLHLVGDGPDRDRLEHLVDTLGVAQHVRIHGQLAAADRDRLLRTAWLTVNASAGEGWGLSVLEANAFGVPALAYRRPGLRDSIIDGETGWLVDDAEVLAEAISGALTQLKDPAFALAIGERAERWAAHFSWTDMAHQMMGILHSEGGRLQQTDERRASTDLATVVHVPMAMLPAGWTPHFRVDDTWTINAKGLSVLLPGADTQSTATALRRAGLPEAVITNGAVRVVVARPRDRISPLTEIFDALDATDLAAPDVRTHR
ncbi:MAG: glycosyltransferase family 4 protein [Lapillicoccus sp.]